MEFTLTFLELFFFGVYLAAPLLLLLVFVIVVLGLIVGKNESWTWFEAEYWAFVTSTTLGYGDFRPGKKISKVLAILIAFTGIILSGLMVAIALYSATESFKINMDMDAVEASIQTHLREP
jgi:voltage-gated potassium channel